MSEFITRLEELDKAANEVVVDTGPNPVYEPPRRAVEAYYECGQLLWDRRYEILALVKAAREVVEGWAPEAYDEMPELQRCRAALEALDKPRQPRFELGEKHNGI